MPFSDKDVDNVWNKGQKIPDKNPNDVRNDACGAEIHRDAHGDTKSDHGWEIDHKDPNGGDELSNLQPLQWENNRRKGDGTLNCDC